MKTELKIDDGIPIPHDGRGRKMSREAQLLRTMHVGQSLLVQKKMANACMLGHRYIGAGKYAVKAEGEGVRIWRKK